MCFCEFTQTFQRKFIYFFMRAKRSNGAIRQIGGVLTRRYLIMKFYLYKSISGETALYGCKGYMFFHIEKKNSYDLLLDEPRIRYEFTDYGWEKISANQAAEILRDITEPYKTRYGLTPYENIKLEEIQNLIKEAR